MNIGDVINQSAMHFPQGDCYSVVVSRVILEKKLTSALNTAVTLGRLGVKTGGIDGIIRSNQNNNESQTADFKLNNSTTNIKLTRTSAQY